MQHSGEVQAWAGAQILNQLVFFPAAAANGPGDPEASLGPRSRWDTSLVSALEAAARSSCPLVVQWKSAGSFCNAAALDALGLPHHDGGIAPGEPAWRRLLPLLAFEPDDDNQPVAALSVDGNRLVERHFKRVAHVIHDASGTPCGHEITLMPVTELVFSSRRERTLRQIAEAGNRVASVESACRELVLRLAGNEHDFPFVIIYEGSRTFAAPELVFQAGFASPPSPAIAESVAGALARSGLDEARAGVVTHLDDRATAELPTGAWSEAAGDIFSFTLPVHRSGRQRAWLVLGLNPYADGDAGFAKFLDQVRDCVHAVLEDVARMEERSQRIQEVSESIARDAALYLEFTQELRTPLTLLMNEMNENATQGMRAHVQDLLRTINSATDIMSIESGDAGFHPVPVDLGNHTAMLIGMLQSAFHAVGRSLVFNGPQATAIARVDPHLWEKLVANLILDIDAATEVTVRLDAAEGEYLRFEVRVAGSSSSNSGLPERSTSSISFRLVDSIARHHGGRMEVPEPGCVHVLIPKGEMNDVQSDAEVATESLQSDPGPYIEEVLASATDEHSSVSRAVHSRTVLVVDDHVQMRRFLERVLVPHFNVETAGDARQAMHILARTRPDLVILDVMLPGQSGIELLHQLRDSSLYKGIPVLIVTARASEEARLEGFAGGADGYLVKPFTTRTLLARVDNILRLGDMRSEIHRRESHMRGRTEKLRRQFTDVLENIRDVVILLDNDFRIVFINRAAASVSRRPVHSLHGRRATDAFPEIRGTALETKLREATMFRRARQMEYTRQETGRTYDLRFVPTSDGTCLFATDITEHATLVRQVKESEARFRLLANSAPVLIWMTDPDDNCTYVNAAWSRFSGRSTESYLGKGWMAFVHPDDLPKVLEAQVTALEQRSAFDIAYRMRNAKNEYRWLHASTSPRLDANGRFLGFIGSAVDITEERHARERELRILQSLQRSDEGECTENEVDDVERRLQESTRRLKTLSRRLMYSQEAEQARLARELHDQIGQSLTGVKLTLRTLSRMPLHEVVQKRVDSAMSQVDDILVEVRELSTTLRPAMLDELGLVPTIRSLADRIIQSSMELHVDAHGMERPVDKEASITCFRIVQSALTNVVRHAEASRVRLTIYTQNDWLVAEIEDDGIGFNADAAFRESYGGGSFGLLSMQERAEFAGGDLHIESEPGSGTVVIVRLPLQPLEDETSP